MTKLNLKKNYLWSICLNFIVIIATIFLIFTLGYFFCLRPKLEMRENHYLNLLDLEKKLNAQLKISMGYSSYQRKIENLKNEFDFYTNNRANKLIYPILSGKLIADFLDINKINILSIKNRKFLSSLKIESDFLSTNNNITNFLCAMGRLDKFIFIENFRWSISNSPLKSQKQNIVFLFKIYTLNFSKKNLILALSKIMKLNSKAEMERDSLIKFPLNKIKMIGYYSDSKIKNLGFVSLPNKQIFKVQLGARLGLERGLVIGIYDRQMFILNGNFQKIIKVSIESRKFS